MTCPVLSISIVSHNQGHLVVALLDDLQQYLTLDFEVILTLNTVESSPIPLDAWKIPIKLIENKRPKGFGENHNAAFELSGSEFFCVMNPDIRLNQNPFPPLLETLSNKSIGVLAPRIVNSAGGLEDSARYFPSPFEMLGKVFGGRSANYNPVNRETLSFPDWVAGMFMLFRNEAYRDIGGFNTRYFLYYEDVDLCARLTLQGYRVALRNNVSVIHDARRTSHVKLRYLKWHLTSMFRFFLSPVYWKLNWHVRKANKG
jgi:GT2 family glycosyltransferase